MNEFSPPPVVPQREWPADLWRIGAILLLTLATRVWVVRHTEVLSRDSIGFIRCALQLEDPPPFDPANPERKMTRAEVVKHTSQPPGYAAALLLVSQPVRAAMGGTTCDSMVFSAQLTSILAALLLVFPMFYLGKLLFDRRIAFVATAIFQVLPVFTAISSDGLSDSLFLSISATALWFSALGFRNESASWFFAAGVASGLAYLVRPEGLVIVLATSVVLLGCKLRGLGWKPMLARGGLLAAGLLLVMSPYVATIGKITNKPTGNGFLKWLEGEEELKPTWMGEPQSSVPPSRGTGVLLADWQHDTEGNKYVWAARALASELLKTSFYAVPFLALIGLWCSRRRLRQEPALALLVVVMGCHLALLGVIASGAGYVASRHTLLIVLCSCYFAAASFPEIGRYFARRRMGSEAIWTALLAVAVVAACVPAGMKKLHVNRAGHHAAGVWLASRIHEDDYVLDPFAWAEFYAGFIRLPETQNKRIRQAYVIVEDPKASPHPRLHLMKTALDIAQHSEVVYYWPENKPKEEAKVYVYRFTGSSRAP